MYYILKDKIPIPVKNVIDWARYYETSNRKVNDTILPDGIHISTVFLGIDHNFGGGKPLLFETMIFGGEHDNYQERYSTWNEAEKGHEKAINLIFK